MTLLGAARRRAIGHTLLDESAFALALALGGAVLLLLTGTQVLDWYWLVILFAGSLGVGMWRAQGRIPSEYVLAQQVDRNLSLADTLSTATYFGAHGNEGNAKIREMQRAEAERTAATVDVATALPFVLPRVLYPAAGLALVALGLFAVRYGLVGSLNLQPSLVSIAFDTFFPQDGKQLGKNGRKSPEDMKKLVVPADSNEEQPPGNEMTPDNLLDTVDVPDVNGSEQGTETKSAAKGPQNQKPEGGEGEQKGEKGSEAGEQGNQSAGQQSQQDGNQDHNKNGKQQAQNGKQGDSSSSLMDKMKDALANLMDKMKSQSKQGDSQQGKGQDGKQGQQGQQAQNQSNQNGAESPDAKGQQQGEGGEKSQSAQAKGGEKSGDNSQSQDGKSGVGKQDGNKDAREAEQLEAMGKISEIIGKRQQNLSGEVMVEVSSSKQQIKTQWSGKNGAHAENGGEVHRDEVPLMYQQYVQQYFEEIRKAPAGAKAGPAKATR